ncbi:MAG: PilZ domain-containing protein [Gemmatimonadales bacterium]|nr:PilZ domain-containing protein [Gemmatimonadales bacterium]
MRKHRRRPRKNTPHLVKVLDAETGESLGRVVDITADGMMLVTDHAYDQGHIIKARLILPVMVQARTDVDLEAEAVWCKQDSNPSYFKVGFHFLNLAGEDGFLLEDVMQKFNLVG